MPLQIMQRDIAWGMTRGALIPIKVRRALRELTEGDLRAALAGEKEVEIARAWERAQWIQKFDAMPTKLDAEKFVRGR